MADLVRAEWAKLFNGRLWWILCGFTVLMSAMACFGFLSGADEQLRLGQTSPADVSTTLVNCWFMVELAAAVLTMIAVTREFGNGAINRSVLVSGGRGRLYRAKLVAAAAIGAVLALITGALAAASPWLLLLTSDQRPEWTGRTTATLLGVMAVVFAGALWGSVLGMLVRNQVVAVTILLFNTWMVSEVLFRVVPAVGRFTVDKAMSSIYHDPQPELLAVPVATVVLAAWILAAGFAARQLLLRRDLP